MDYSNKQYVVSGITFNDAAQTPEFFITFDLRKELAAHNIFGLLCHTAFCDMIEPCGVVSEQDSDSELKWKLGYYRTASPHPESIVVIKDTQMVRQRMMHHLIKTELLNVKVARHQGGYNPAAISLDQQELAEKNLIKIADARVIHRARLMDPLSLHKRKIYFELFQSRRNCKLIVEKARPAAGMPAGRLSLPAPGR